MSEGGGTTIEAPSGVGYGKGCPLPSQLGGGAFYMEISNNDIGQFYHIQCPQRTARFAHAASPTGLSIGYRFSVNTASSTFIISADFLIVLNVLFNFHFKRIRDSHTGT